MSTEAEERITRIEPTILILIDIIVPQTIGVFNNIRENSNENKVLDEEMTVEADIDVSSKLQLNRTPLTIVLRRINGAVERYRDNVRGS